jgi:uncharacterized membrane protein HdeD (DUF308 family)
METLAHNWWVVLLRGLAAIAFGLIALAVPGITLAFLVIVFAVYALTDGVLAIVSAVRHRAADRWWMLLLEGIAGLAVGVLTLIWPGVTAMALLYLIAAWAIVTGVLEIVAAVQLRKAIHGEWLLALAGVASVALGVLLAVFPGPGALAVVMWIGIYAIIAGASLVGLSLRLRHLEHERVGRPPERLAEPHPV